MGKVPGVLAFLAFALFLCLGIAAQDDKQIRSFITTDDLKKLDKAEKYRSEADGLTDEVNKINLEVVNIQADTELSEKAISKKVQSLEDDAIAKHISASGLYEKCNEIKFSVYKKCIDDFRAKNPDRETEFIQARLLEEQAGDNYYQAISYRVEAKKLDSYAKIEKLNSSYSLEVQALQEQISALQIYYGISTPGVAENTAISEEFSKDNAIEPQEELITSPGNSGEIVLNQEMVDSYNRYMASGQYSDTSISTGKIAAVTDFDSEKLLGLWHEYMYGERDLSEFSETIIPGQSEAIDTTSAKPENSTALSEDGGVVIENEKDIASIGEPGEVIFRVQIAANRTELSQRALSRMYYGTKSLEVINENGWYKYSVGDFSTYDEASAFRKKSGVSNAFIVGYRKDSEIRRKTVTTAESETAVADPATANSRMPAGILFRVQIAASRTPIPAHQLSSIYNGEYAVEMISEDGWYKYQIMGVRLYSDARRIMGLLQNKGYIVAYEEGTRVKLPEAISKNKDLEKVISRSGRKGNIHETEFHVQLAASRSPMPAEELAGLYTGNEPVFAVIEDGWYKYHLKAGNSYSQALELRNNCNVKGAFIVAYTRAVKVNTDEAVRKEIN